MDNREESKNRLEFLTDHFFDQMRHDASIESPYYTDKEYAGNIARDYLDEHPDFETPPMDERGCYIYSDELLRKLEDYCDEKCEYYGYDGSDYDYDDDDDDYFVDDLYKEKADEKEL